MNTFRRWELSDYCRIYGRIIPHYVQDGRHFVSFHCSNREENTQTIKVDESLGEIKLVDHIIVAGNDYFSFADEGLL